MLAKLVALITIAFVISNVNDDYAQFFKELSEASVIRPCYGGGCDDIECIQQKCKDTLSQLKVKYVKFKPIITLYQMNANDISFITPEKITHHIRSIGLNKTHIDRLVCGINIYLYGPHTSPGSPYYRPKIFGVGSIARCHDQPTNLTKEFLLKS